MKTVSGVWFFSKKGETASGRKRLRKPYRLRIVVAGLVFAVAFVLLWARLFFIQVARHDYYVERANQQHRMTVEILPRRGRIFDRNGEPLAISAFMDSLYIDPRKIPHQREAIALRISEAFDLTCEKALALFDKNAIMPLARKVSLEKTDEARGLIFEFNLPRDAIYPVKESKRAYPHDQLAAHVLGYTTTDEGVSGDNKGLEGIEREYDEDLRGDWARFRVLRNARSRSIEPVDDEVYFSTFGNDIVLTIDTAIQSVAERELARAVDYQKAIGGALVVLDCRSGAILAMANCPTYNPNRFDEAPAFTRRNRCLTDFIETGSVMKIFLAAMLIESDLLRLDEVIDCHGGVAFINGKRVMDAPGHSLGQVPFREVFTYSSNVGCVTVAQRVQTQEYAAWLERFGFGSKTGVDLPGEVEGRLSLQRPTDRDRAAMGYSVGVTALQVAAALCVIGNHGVTVQPHIVKEIRDCHNKVVKTFTPGPGRYVISSVTARKTLELMEGVVEEGTGTKATIEGYRIAGKTGTAMKIDPETKEYSKKMRFCSFACIAPYEDPRLAIYCYIDEPKRDRYGGDVAAPVVGEVASVALRVVGVMPSKTDGGQTPDIELIVDRVQKRSMAQMIPSLRVNEPGRMPDLGGLTMTEAQKALALLPLDVKVKFQGSGVVVEQTPAPGSPFESCKGVTVVFGNPKPAPVGDGGNEGGGVR